MNQVAAGHRVQVQIPEMHLAGASHRPMNQKNCQMSQIYQCQMDLKERCFTLICQFFRLFPQVSPIHWESSKGQKGFWMLQLGSQQSCTHYNHLFFRSLWEHLKIWSQRHQAIGHHPVLPKLLAQFETIEQGPGVHQVVYHLLPIEYRKPISSWMISFQSSFHPSSLRSFPLKVSVLQKARMKWVDSTAADHCIGSHQHWCPYHFPLLFRQLGFFFGAQFLHFFLMTG